MGANAPATRSREYSISWRVAELEAEVARLKALLWKNQQMLETNERSKSVNWHELRLQIIENRNALKDTSHD